MGSFRNDSIALFVKTRSSSGSFLIHDYFPQASAIFACAQARSSYFLGLISLHTSFFIINIAFLHHARPCQHGPDRPSTSCLHPLNAMHKQRAHLDNDGAYAMCTLFYPSLSTITLRVPHNAEREQLPVVPVSLRLWPLLVLCFAGVVSSSKIETRVICLHSSSVTRFAGYFLLFTYILIRLLEMPLPLLEPPVHAVDQQVRRTHCPEPLHMRVLDYHLHTQ